MKRKDVRCIVEVVGDGSIAKHYDETTINMKLQHYDKDRIIINKSDSNNNKEELFELRVKLDSIKTKYCEDNNIHLKYIVYQRSQDAVFGYDNDILWHHNVQLMLANKLSEPTALNKEIICDNIINNVGSLHVYERHFKYLDEN